MTIFRRTEKRSSAPMEWGNTTPPSNGMLGSPAAGVSVTEKSVLAIAAAYGAVGVISDSFASLPLKNLSSQDPKVRKEQPLPEVVKNPYSEISQIDWMTQFAVSLALRGNFFGEIVEFDNELYPSQIKPIHPDGADVRRGYTGNLEYRFYGRLVPNNRVFHIKLMTTPGSLVGVNPIEYLKNSFGLARAQDMYGGAFFANSALPMGAIEVEDELDPDETRALAEQWTSLHQGITKSSLPAVLTGGAKFNPITISNSDLQFIEARGLSQTEIAGMIFRVPPHMVGMVDKTTSWGKGIEEQENAFIRNTLLPYIRRYEQAMTDLLPEGNFIKMDVSHRLRASTKERYEAYGQARLNGWMSANDIRAKEDEAPIPNGNEYILPPGSELLKAKVEEAKRAKEKAEEPPPPPPTIIQAPGQPGVPPPAIPAKPEGEPKPND